VKFGEHGVQWFNLAGERGGVPDCKLTVFPGDIVSPRGALGGGGGEFVLMLLTDVEFLISSNFRS